MVNYGHSRNVSSVGKGRTTQVRKHAAGSFSGLVKLDGNAENQF